jgi:hypothetical protein
VVTDPQRLSQVFVELADTLVDDFDVVEFLTTLAHRSVELLRADEAGVVLADVGGTLRSVASSHETARLLELFELQNHEGPCLECYRTGQQILNAPIEPPFARWPRFGAEARRVGFSEVHALPMRLRGQVIGAVNVFGTSSEHLTQSEADVGQALADVATVGLLQERSIREARVLNDQLQSALRSRIVIEQAKGMLAERHRLEMGAAFDALRAQARADNVRLGELASAVVSGAISLDVFGPGPG